MERYDLRELSRKYLEHCRVIRNYQPNTISGYESTFKLFFKLTEMEFADQLNKRTLEEFFFNGRDRTELERRNAEILHEVAKYLYEVAC